MTFLAMVAAFGLLIVLIDLTPLPDLALRLLSMPEAVSEREAAANSRPVSSAVTPLGTERPPTSPGPHLPLHDDGRALERPTA